jgi:hypothetical protein
MDSVEELRAAVADPETFLESLANAAGPAAKKWVIARLRPSVEPQLSGIGLDWEDVVPVLDGVGESELKKALGGDPAGGVSVASVESWLGGGASKQSLVEAKKERQKQKQKQEEDAAREAAGKEGGTGKAGEKKRVMRKRSSSSMAAKGASNEGPGDGGLVDALEDAETALVDSPAFVLLFFPFKKRLPTQNCSVIKLQNVMIPRSSKPARRSSRSSR